MHYLYMPGKITTYCSSLPTGSVYEWRFNCITKLGKEKQRNAFAFQRLL